MTREDFIEDINAEYQKKMARCEIFDEEKYRVYEMFLEWYPDSVDIPDEIDEFDITNLRDDIWLEFCEVHNINRRTAHFGDSYPPDLDPDERDDYDDFIEDMMTKD